MKLIVACACMLLVAGAYSQPASQSLVVGQTVSLPIGNRSNMIAHLEREITDYRLMFVITNMGWISGGSYPYNTNMGKLADVVRTNLPAFAQQVFKPSDAGSTAEFTLCLVYRSSNGIEVPISSSSRPFTVVFENGKVVLPFPELLAWPLSQFVPISGAAVGVERVDYTFSQAGQTFVEPTPNGILPWCYWSTLTYGDGTLYLYSDMVDSQYYTTYDWTNAEVVLYYSVGGGQYSKFNAMGHGEKTYSTIVSLEMKKVAGTPYVALSGWPGKQVEVQTSSNLLAWTALNTVTLNSNGTAETSLPQTAQPLFVRGHLLSP